MDEKGIKIIRSIFVNNEMRWRVLWKIAGIIFLLTAVLGCENFKKELDSGEKLNVPRSKIFTAKFSKIKTSTIHDPWDPSLLILEGTVINSGNQIWYAPWHIAVDYYADNVRNVKVGTGVCKVAFNLLPKEKTAWQIAFKPASFRKVDEKIGLTGI